VQLQRLVCLPERQAIDVGDPRARHHRHVPRDRRASAGLSDLGLRALGTHRDIYGLSIDQLTPAAFKRARG
jgi:hypothetical protein